MFIPVAALILIALVIASLITISVKEALQGRLYRDKCLSAEAKNTVLKKKIADLLNN